MRIVDQHPLAAVEAVEEVYLWPPEPPPEEETLMDLLHRELGAYLIGADGVVTTVG